MEFDTAPVFIGGLSYSGKTQLRLMLENIPGMQLSRRTFFWRSHLRRYGDLAQNGNLSRCLGALQQDQQVKALNPDFDRIEHDFQLGPRSYGRLFSLILYHNALGQGKTRWGIQAGMVEYFTDRIMEDLPGAKFIHMIRDPRMRIAESIRGASLRPWKTGWETGHWIQSAGQARRNAAAHPDHYMVVTWEALRDRTDETLRKICTFINESWKPSLASVAIEDKEHPLSFNNQAFIERRSGKEMASFGYQSLKYDSSPKQWLAYYLYAMPVGLLGLLLWRNLGLRRLPSNANVIKQSAFGALRWAR